MLAELWAEIVSDVRVGLMYIRALIWFGLYVGMLVFIYVFLGWVFLWGLAHPVGCC